MNSFWETLAEMVSDRNPIGAACGILLKLFFFSLFGWLGYRGLCALGLQDGIIYFVPLAAILFFTWLVRGIRNALARARARYKSTPLSRDEILKARSKLTNSSHFKKA
jgi:hypothetical protein